MSLRGRMVAAAGLCLLSVGVAHAQATGGVRTPAASDPVRGATLYTARCGGCHSPDRDRIGPHHRGVVGRRAGTVPGYAYSDALRRSGIVWTPGTLDRWLTGPMRLVPGTRMGLSVADPRDRRDIIAYLASLR